MGGFFRTYVSRRLLSLSEGEIAALMTAMRQLGIGSQVGAEALAIFHQRDRGAEQGDVDGALECSLALEWWQPKHECALPPSRLQVTFHGLVSTTHWKNKRVEAEHVNKMQKVQHFQLGAPPKLVGADDPRHAPQENGCVADLWYIDDGDILRHPTLVPSHLQECQRQSWSNAKSAENRSHHLASQTWTN